MHDQIHAHFVHMCEQGEGQAPHEFTDIHDKAYFLRSCFLNHTANHASLRLTPIGNTILKLMYEHWRWSLTDEDRGLLNKGNTLIQLHNSMKAPYYWDSRNFYVYHSEHALEYELVSQDFSAWIRSH